ncbi:MAG: DUF5686 and carboxypeptidase regulatory-like domain-containing protein [Tannerella sp.]|jgi:hypothetical protein|nr:DUF5686 and carboxypeptidase regulatory-like domain-containing protein [Tannerella sp.]
MWGCGDVEMWRCGDVGILLFLFLLLPFYSSAQFLKGRVVDSRNQPVTNAAVYIKELQLGIISNENGEYRTKTGQGSYTIEFSSLGFEKKILNVTIPASGLDLVTTLEDKVFELQEVIVAPGNEDPAYRIMRNLIARAPYFYNQIKSYESDIYLKGSFKVEKAPKLLMNKELKTIVGKLFIVESQNKVKYKEPNQYEQHVVAIKSSIPSELDIDHNVPLGIVTINIYHPENFGGLLSPASFSVYKFSLEDSYKESDNTIYKIKIIPKKKNRRLANGYLYIVDGTWNVRQAIITQNEMPGLTTNFNLQYNEIRKGAFLPSSYDMSMSLDLMGIKGFGKFYASIKYDKVETNSITISSEELSAKDNLTNRETRKIAKILAKTTESEAVKKEKKNLEIKPMDSLVVITRDSLVFLRDSSFWEMGRKTPLNAEEILSYIRRDSLKTVTDSLSKADSINNRKVSSWLSSIAVGGTKKFSKNTSIQFKGILGVCPEYNFTDGFWLGQKISVTSKIDDNKKIIFTPSAYYATARKQWVWNADASFAYAPLKDGYVRLSAGHTSADFAGNYGTGRFINSVASLFFAENPVKFYDRKYITATNYIDVANGLRLNTQINCERRRELQNITTYSFFGKAPDTNLPFEQYTMPDHNSLSAKIAIQYTPRYYYHIRKGRKEYSRSVFPTFTLSYEKAFAGNNPLNSSYEKIEATVQQNKRINLFSEISYAINAGTFLSTTKMYLPDFKHFNTNELFITDKSLWNSFSLLDNYAVAANDKWLQAHINYTSEHLLLTNLPFLQKYMMSESFHLKSLFMPNPEHQFPTSPHHHISTSPHFEAGYSLGLASLGRVGFFAGFDNWKYNSFGIKVSLPLINIF